MRSSWILIVMAVALFMGRAHAINRVGNNDDVPGFNGELHDANEGFTAAVPNEFPNANSLSDGSVQLRSFSDSAEYIEMGEGFAGPLSMAAYPLATVYPELTKASEAQVRDYMVTQLHAQVTEIARKGCGYFLLGENPQGFVGIGKWNEHGYFLSVPKSAENSGKDGIIHIMQSTKIETPCK